MHTSKIERRTLVYAGLDFIFDYQGKLYFIEANDHPVAMDRADKFALQTKNNLFSGEGLKALVDELIGLSKGKTICLLLPDCFVINVKDHIAKEVYLYDSIHNQGRTKLSLAEFNSLATSILDKGIPCFICDHLAIKTVKNKIVLNNGTEIGVLYRRSYQYPKEFTITPCVNDLRQRVVCSDKLVTSHVINRLAPEVVTIPSYSTENSQELNKFLKLSASENKYIICKPRRGASSRNVKRILATELVSKKSNYNFSSGSIYQPWIKPLTQNQNGYDYCFDIRIYLVAGKVVAGLARRAAAPIEGVTVDSPLAWMTTTGPSLALCMESSDSSNESINLTFEQSKLLFTQSKKIVSALEYYVDNLEYQTTCSDLSDFTSQLSINGQLEMITLLSS